MTLATRSFLVTTALVSLTVLGLVVVTDRILRERLEAEVAAGLAREARLAARFLPSEPALWPDVARTLGRDIGRRITLIAPGGRVLGDTDFGETALDQLENHATRPEVRGATDSGIGQDSRRSASNNERQMYLALRGGPPGIGVVRVSASLAAVDAQIASVQRAVAWAGIVAVLVAAVLAWPLTRALTRPLAQLTGAARQIAVGQEPVFPESRVPEIRDHVLALREMATELTARLQAIEREREEARTLVASLSDGVLAVDPGGTIVTCNPAARRLLGYARNATLPPLGELFHDKRARDVLRDAAAGRVVEQAELRVNERDLLVTARPLVTGGTVVVLHDVTALRKLETMRRDFVANVSHELKTPLTSIIGYAETLAMETASTAETRTFAHTILGSARRMQRLVDGLLDLSRIESGRWRPEPERIDLAEAVRQAWEPFSERAASSGVKFETDIPPTGRSVNVDPDALRQILTNLIDNALRHTPADGRIRVGARADQRGVALVVEDTGSGIPAEHLPRIFERFYRVDAGRARHQGGTGLGLAIVKHLVEAHGGRIEAQSVVGRGTTVRLSLPA